MPTTGFLWEQGRVTEIDFIRVIAGATVTVPCAINDAGQMVGYYSATPSHEHGFVLNPDR